MKFFSKIFNRSKDKQVQQVTQMRGFNMANVNRLTADWLSFVKSFNYDIKVGGNALIARARELFQNDPYAKKIVGEKKKGIVGPNGFTLRNRAGEYQSVDGNYRFVKDKAANSIINEAWWQWGKGFNCTVEQDQSFREHCGMLVQTVMVDGEVFIKKLEGPAYNAFGFTTQVITAEYCDWTLNKKLDNGNEIVMGIEVDKYWRKVAYWFRTGTPKDEIDYGYSWARNYKRVPADQIIHLYVKEVAHQLRGVTLLAPVGIRLKMLYGFEEAALTRSRSSAMVPGAIEKIPNTMSMDGPGVQASDKDSSGDWLVSLEQEEYMVVKDGYKINKLDSDYPHSLHAPFAKVNLRGISAGSDIGYSTISGDYESVTWHSGKLEKRNEFKAYLAGQNWFTDHYLNLIFTTWLEMAFLAGKLKFATGKALPIEKMEKFNAPEFFGPPWESANEKEDLEANIVAVQSGQSTFGQILGKRGLDLEEQLDEIAEEKQLFVDKGMGDMYDMIISKYKTAPAESSDAKDAKEAAEKNNKSLVNNNGYH